MPDERGQPIMQYVRDLEGRVRHYRAREMRSHANWFVLGVFVGVVAESTLFFVLRALRGG